MKTQLPNEGGWRDSIADWMHIMHSVVLGCPWNLKWSLGHNQE